MTLSLILKNENASQTLSLSKLNMNFVQGGLHACQMTILLFDSSSCDVAANGFSSLKPFFLGKLAQIWKGWALPG